MIHEFSQTTDLLGAPGDLRADFRSDIEKGYPLAQQHHQTSPDIAMAEQMARETMAISGADVEVFIRTENADKDRVWDEDPNPTYWPPVPMKAFFAPKPIELAQKLQGADAPNKLEINFLYSDLRRHFPDRFLRSGDVVRVPYNADGNLTPKLFRVVNATPDGQFRYGWLYIKAQTESLIADITVMPIEVRESQHMVDIDDSQQENV